ncbi:MAG: PEP/pyruvate-binding domain-containing protein [Myxococcota bacterium]|jgi:CheY-like chemotaxis protein
MPTFKQFLFKYTESSRFSGFHKLMQERVKEILLVSSPYDSFVLAEDGKLQEMILGEFMELNLNYAPGITRVSSGAEALKLAEQKHRFNLIITTMHVDDMQAIELGQKLRENGIETPIILLTYDNRELADLLKRHDTTVFDRIFNWQGDFRIFLTIVKHIEDLMNVEHDNAHVGVQVIILVEDSIRYYSSYLPMFYTELFKQSQKLISEGPSLSQKVLRMRARPKILLANNYEQAWQYFDRYSRDVLGIISDMRFPRGGQLEPYAGLELVKQVRQRRIDLPVLLQSSSPENSQLASGAGAAFIWKDSPTLLEDLRAFMVQNFAFGDFIFRMPDGREVGRATDVKSLEEQLQHVPAESIMFHAERDHFSNWLKARTEFALADMLKAQKVSEYSSTEEVRSELVTSLHEQRLKRYRGTVVDFDPNDFETSTNIARIGSGSIGGKARGMAFVSGILNRYGIRHHFPGVRIFVPGSVVLCTEVFSQFIEDNKLMSLALSCDDEAVIAQAFQKARFPETIREQLRSFLRGITYPLAVRSSSILEDSLFQPFAGVYETYMVANNNADLERRLADLLSAVKGVYASTFTRQAKDYVRATNYRLEEEKMAVIIQRVIGNRYGSRFYPHFSGVVRSHNSYPMPPMKSEDGTVAMALGLGKTVVDGDASISFSPRHPRKIIGWSGTQDYLKYSQREFYALDLAASGMHGALPSENFVLSLNDLEVAEDDGTLGPVASTYSYENDAMYDGLSRGGQRIVSFAPILKDRYFPLGEILQVIMDMGRWGMNSPVEIEFAVNLMPQAHGDKEFGVLQMRPLVLNAEQDDVNIEGVDEKDIVCRSPKVLGNGKIDNIRDIVLVDIDRFERSKSSEVAQEVSKYNIRLNDEGRPYLLIGMGRWGSSDPWMGIPVAWGSISGARVIVETGFRDFRVTPSQGSHFFQNLTSFSVGYFTINEFQNEGSIDWKWLMEQTPVSSLNYTRHIRLDSPLMVKINGRTNEGIIIKPALR